MDLSRPYIVWSPSYSVNNHVIDLEHKSLVDTLNLVYILAHSPPNPFVLEYALARLVEYTESHFKDEEEILAAANYPELQSHRALHLRMIEKTGALKNALQKTKDINHSSEILNFLKDWWINHITKMDVSYKKYV